MPSLILPSVQYKASYLQALAEFHAEGRRLKYDFESVAADFAGFVQSLRAQADRANLKPGLVPASVYWLVAGEEFIGHSTLRHVLNDWLRTYGGHIGYEIRPSRRRQGYGTQILRQVLSQARVLGLPRVLVTCDSDNIGSRKIIEANGGRFENALDMEGTDVKKLRYWIDLA